MKIRRLKARRDKGKAVELVLGKWCLVWYFGQKIMLMNFKTYNSWTHTFKRNKPTTLGEKLNNQFIYHGDLIIHGIECGCDICLDEMKNDIDNSMK